MRTSNPPSKVTTINRKPKMAVLHLGLDTSRYFGHTIFHNTLKLFMSFTRPLIHLSIPLPQPLQQMEQTLTQPPVDGNDATINQLGGLVYDALGCVGGKGSKGLCRCGFRLT